MSKDNEIVVKAPTAAEAAKAAKQKAAARWGPDGFGLEVSSTASKDIRTGEVGFMAVATQNQSPRAASDDDPPGALP